jgi:hypothetical protein
VSRRSLFLFLFLLIVLLIVLHPIDPVVGRLPPLSPCGPSSRRVEED